MSRINRQISAIFEQTSAILEILGGDRFRINAFQRAARIVKELIDDVDEIGPDVERLKSIEGIGKGTAQRIAEYMTSGRIKEHEELVAKIPAGLLELLEIPGLGPKTVALLWKQAGVESLRDLSAKLETDELASLPGLGVKKLEKLRKSIAFAQTSADRIRIGQAMPVSLWFVEQLRSIKEVSQVAYAGSLRRGQETIGDIDLIVAASRGSGDDQESEWNRTVEMISDTFVKLDPVQEVLVQGNTKTSVRAIDPSGQVSRVMQVDLRVVPIDNYGAALLYFTGSKEHNVALRQRAIQQGTKLNEYGLYRDEKIIASRAEEDIYQAMGLAWIPPELRLGRNELVLAETAAIPPLLEIADIRAELHAHTVASDGRWSIRQLALAAADRGFHTVAVTDHSHSQTIANGLSIERMEKHIAEVRAVGSELKDTIALLVGSEVDILADGSLDYPDDVLAQLDVVVASPHSALSQTPAKATARLLKAIENPYVTLIGHPTGRIIGRREGLDPDMKQIIRAAAQRGIALEINANSWRLDLRDTHARWAIESGVKLAINTDAHGPGDMEQLIYGVLTARRAGATQAHVVNCMSRAELASWLKSCKR